MSATRSDWALATGLSVAAAFGWATYYLFILSVGASATASAALVYPFLFGGGVYAALAARRGEGRALLRLFASPPALVRTAVLVGLQVAVLASTYLMGSVDASLLSLLGDVVATPLLVIYWTQGHSAPAPTAALGAGLLLSLVGGSLAIAGGNSLETVPPLGWLVVPAVPITVAFYFVLTARAAERGAGTAVIAPTMLAAGLATALLAGVVPGGWAGLVRIGPWPLLLLAVNGVVSFFAAQLCYFAAIARVGMVVPPMLMSGIPVFTLLLSAAFLGVQPTVIALLGIPLAILGGLITLRSEQRSASGRTTASR